MKIWKFSESSAYGGYAQQKVWSKHKTTFHDDTPNEIEELYSRFDNSLMYRKVTSISVSQPCVYFLYLPNDTYKIGETTVGGLHNRLSNAQTYFIDDVVLNGVQLCESKPVAQSLEQTVLDYFLGIEKPRREVVAWHGSEEIESYISEYCLPQNVSQKIMEKGKGSILKKSKDKMRVSESDSQHTGDFQ